MSTFRLYVLRATYLLIAVGLGFMIGPGLIEPPADLEHMRGVVRALLGAMGLLALLGLRYPLRMLPLLFFELVWKSLWLAVFGLPLWRAGALDGAMRATAGDWRRRGLHGRDPRGYVARNYVRRAGDPWTRRAATPDSAHAVEA